MSISILNRGASGGLKPELTVTAPSGSTLDILKDSIIIDTYTLGADETEHTFVLKVGDYTVRGTLGSKTSSVNVVIDAIAQYELLIKYLDPVFANNTWDTIIDACQNNNVPETWAVGNQKTMLINGTNYAIDIIGKNHDSYSDGSGTVPLTFQMHECYGTNYAMNSSNTNSGGWTSCAMRSTHLPAIMALMPTEVQSGIKEVNKLTSAGSKSSAINTTADKLFLLSEIEVFGSVTKSASGEGKQYAYYAAGNSKAKTRNGSTNYWWERSPKLSSSSEFCGVHTSASADTFGASYTMISVAFAFCF